MEKPGKKYFRLAPGKEVRLKHAYYITCTDIFKDKEGIIREIYCTYDPATKGGWSSDGRKVKGTLHWVSADKNINAEIRLYNHLFNSEDPESSDNFINDLNNKSLIIIKNAILEEGMQNAKHGISYQFLRNGYFCLDKDSTSNKIIINRTVSLKDSWKKIKSS